MIVRVVLVTLFVLFLIVAILTLYEGSSLRSDGDEIIDDSLASQIAYGNYSEEESVAIVSAAKSFEDETNIVVSSVYEHEVTNDHYVTIQDGEDVVVIIVRNGSNYAYSVNSGHIERCYTNQESKYCVS